MTGEDVIVWNLTQGCLLFIIGLGIGILVIDIIANIRNDTRK